MVSLADAQIMYELYVLIMIHMLLSQLLMFYYGGTRKSLQVCLVEPLLCGFSLNYLNTTYLHWSAIYWYSLLLSFSCWLMQPSLSTGKVLGICPIIKCLFNSIKPWIYSFLWNRPPPQIPDLKIPEKPVLEFASALTYEINRGLTVLREIASGRDLKKFLGVCCF